MSRSKSFLTLMILFLGGVLTGSSFSSVLVIAVSVVIISATLFLLGKKYLLIGLIFALSFSVGVLMIQNAEANRESLTQFDNVNFPITLVGHVNNDPFSVSGKQYFNFKFESVTVTDLKAEFSDTVRISTNLIPEYRYGDTLKITGFLVDGRISNPDIEDSDIEKPFFTFLYRFVFGIKEKFTSAIDNSVLEPNASYINGILLGERSAIPFDLKEAFQKTGMVHILAISGYNVTIVVSLIYGLFLLFLKRSKAFWFAIIGIALFTILTGASASVVRAAIMGSLVLLAHKEGRRYASAQALAFTAALMVLLNPLVIQEDLGFLLSFAATAGMLYMVPVLEKGVRKVPKFYGVKEAAVTTTAAQIMVLPLIVYFFGAVSWISLLVNILVLPLMPLAMLSGFVTGLAGLVNSQLGILVGYIPWLITGLQIWIIEFFGRFDEFNISFNLPMLIFVYSVLFYVIYRSFDRNQ